MADPPIVHVDDEPVKSMDISDSSSVRSSLFDFPIENGRQYHAYKDGIYLRPNDEAELERLDIMNELFNIVNDRQLHRAPIGPKTQRILDIGAGTGIWAIEMGDSYPNAEVTGIDISANMPSSVPPNVKFEIDDVEDEWADCQPFDYIHSRYMAGAIKDWPKLMAQSYRNLKPGGWVEFVDLQIDFYSQDGSLRDDHAVKRWIETSAATMEDNGQTLRPGARLGKWMYDAGFVNIQVDRDPLPIGPWPRNKKLKEIGLYNFIQLWEGIQGMALRLFINLLGWSREELEILLMEVRRDLKDPRIHHMYDLYTVCAQKPEVDSSKKLKGK